MLAHSTVQDTSAEDISRLLFFYFSRIIEIVWV